MRKFALLSIALCLLTVLSAQSRKGQFFIAPGAQEIPHKLWVKFNSDAAENMDQVRELKKTHRLSFAPAFNMREDKILALEAQAKSRSPRASHTAYGLTRLKEVHYPNANNAELIALATELEKLDCVQYCELISTRRPAPPADYSNYQIWTYPDDNVYNGHDFEYAWSVNAKGQGVTVRDIEYDWNIDHVDLADRPVRFADGLTPKHYSGSDYFAFTEHGTCIAGIICANHDNDGMNGGAPEIEELVLYTEETDAGWERTEAMIQAVEESKAGDIFLLEIQMYGPNEKYVPAEFSQVIWDLTRIAVDKGVIVLATGGNGGENLDDPEFQGYMDRGNSGAIMIGGSNSNDLSRWSGSTYGSRFDVQSWGGAISCPGAFNQNFLPGTNASNLNATYTGTFGGTSGAGGIMAALCACVQSYALQKWGRFMTPLEMKTLLVENSVPQGIGQYNGNIGPMPVLDLVLQAVDNYDPQLWVENEMKDQSLNSEEVLEIDLTSVFKTKSGATPSFQVTRNNNPSIASATISSNQLKITSSGELGTVYIEVRAQHQGETLFEDIILSIENNALTTINFDGLNDAGIGWGDQAEADIIALIRLSSDELQNYYGKSTLNGFQFFLSDIQGSAWTTLYPVIYTGTASGPQTEIYRGPNIGPDGNLGEWNYYFFPENDLVDLEAGQDYFVGYDIHAVGGWPCGIDAGPAITGKGDWVKENTEPWITMSEGWGGSWDVNWNIRALIQVDQATGIESTAQPTVHVFPNPAKNQISVSSTSAISGLVLRDMTGRTIWQYHTEKQPRRQLNCQLPDIPAGNYILFLQGSDLSYHRLSIVK